MTPPRIRRAKDGTVAVWYEDRTGRTVAVSGRFVVDDEYGERFVAYDPSAAHEVQA